MQKPPTSRIVNGFAANDYIPWQVSIQNYFLFDWDHFCGGIILDEKTILTASHCYYPCYRENCRIVAAIMDLRNLSGQVKYHTFFKIVHLFYLKYNQNCNTDRPCFVTIFKLAKTCD